MQALQGNKGLFFAGFIFYFSHAFPDKMLVRFQGQGQGCTSVAAAPPPRPLLASRLSLTVRPASKYLFQSERVLFICLNKIK